MEDSINLFKTEKFRNFFLNIDRESIANLIFYLGISLELLFVLYDKSALHSLNTGMWFRVTFLLFTVKVLMTRYTLKEWCWMMGLGVVAFVSYRCSSRNDMLRLVVMCAAFKNVDYRKVMKYAFYVMLSGCLLIVFLAFAGVFGEMSMTAAFRMKEVETRYTFGFGHPNQMHCMFWVVATLGVFCFWEKVNWIWLSVLMLVNIVLFVFTDSRGGLIGMSCTFLVSMLLRYVRKVREAKWPYALVIFCLILVGVFSVSLAYFGYHYYQYDYPQIWESPTFIRFYEWDARFLSGRLWYCYGMKITDLRNFSLFSDPTNTEFMDMGFYKLFYWYGYVPASLYLLANGLLAWYAYKKKECRIFMIVACFNAYTFLEAHLISDYLGRNYLFFLMGGLWSQILHADHGQSFAWWEIPGFIRKGRNP